MNAPSIDDVLSAFRLDQAGLSNEKVRDIFRQVCYVPSWEMQRKDISFRDHRMLKHFGHSLEMAYYSVENWSIHWPAALMLIAKYRLLEGQR